MNDLANEEYPVVEIKDPPKPWSPCKGPGCDHPSHKEGGPEPVTLEELQTIRKDANSK